MRSGLLLAVLALVPACEPAVDDSLAVPEERDLDPDPGDPPIHVCKKKVPTLQPSVVTGTSVQLIADYKCEGWGLTMQRASGPNGPWLTIDSDTAPWVFLDGGLSSQTTYYYRVGTVDEDAVRYSGVVHMTTLIAPPSKPTLVVENAGSDHERFRAIATDQSTTEVSFTLYHKGPDDGPYQVAGFYKPPYPGSVGQKIEFNPVHAPSGSHCFMVHATNLGGTSASNEVCVTHDWPNEDPPDTVRHWSLSGRLGWLKQPLRNSQQDAFLSANGWTQVESESRVSIHRKQFGSQAPILGNELVAIQIQGKGYLRAASSGKNIGFASTPAYEWRFVDDRRESGPVGSGGLYNDRRNLWALADDGAASGVSFRKPAEEKYLSAVPTQPFVGYVLEIDGSGTLTRLQPHGAPEGAGSFFALYPGKPVTQCGLPGAGALVGFTDEDDMLAFFGTAKPKLPLVLHGCPMGPSQPAQYPFRAVVQPD